MMAFQNLTYMEAAANVPRPNERDMFSVVTSNMFQALENFEEFPELGSNKRTRNAPETRVFEPYRPTAQARRRIGGGVEPRRNQSASNPKRRRNTPASSPIGQQEKKQCVNERQTQAPITEKNSYPKPTGYEFFRQDRNYSKYESGKQNTPRQKTKELTSTSNNDKIDNDPNETLLCSNSGNSSFLSTEENIMIVDGTANTAINS